MVAIDDTEPSDMELNLDCWESILAVLLQEGIYHLQKLIQVNRFFQRLVTHSNVWRQVYYGIKKKEIEDKLAAQGIWPFQYSFEHPAENPNMIAAARKMGVKPPKSNAWARQFVVAKRRRFCESCFGTKHDRNSEHPRLFRHGDTWRYQYLCFICRFSALFDDCHDHLFKKKTRFELLDERYITSSFSFNEITRFFLVPEERFQEVCGYESEERAVAYVRRFAFAFHLSYENLYLKMNTKIMRKGICNRRRRIKRRFMRTWCCGGGYVARMDEYLALPNVHRYIIENASFAAAQETIETVRQLSLLHSRLHNPPVYSRPRNYIMNQPPLKTWLEWDAIETFIYEYALHVLEETVKKEKCERKERQDQRNNNTLPLEDAATTTYTLMESARNEAQDNIPSLYHDVLDSALDAALSTLQCKAIHEIEQAFTAFRKRHAYGLLYDFYFSHDEQDDPSELYSMVCAGGGGGTKKPPVLFFFFGDGSLG